MNQYSDEKEIKELFRKLKHHDERLAPTFAETWSTVVSRAGKVARPHHILRIAAATVVLALVLSSAIIIFREFSQQHIVHESALTLSQWKSPTDFLLKSPDEQLLNSVPQLGTSLREINTLPSNKN